MIEDSTCFGNIRINIRLSMINFYSGYEHYYFIHNLWFGFLGCIAFVCVHKNFLQEHFQNSKYESIILYIKVVVCWVTSDSSKYCWMWQRLSQYYPTRACTISWCCRHLLSFSARAIFPCQTVLLLPNFNVNNCVIISRSKSETELYFLL